MESFTSVTGAAAPLLIDDLNTDQLIPSAYIKDLHANLADAFLAYMRRRPDGSRDTGFVLEKPQYAGAPVLVTGRNFGCGSSREHAVWAMRAFGVRCVIGPSPAQLFRDNCLKNGVLPVSLDDRRMAALVAQVLVADGRAPVTVDLETCRIAGPGDFACDFEIASFERAALLEGLDDIGQTLKNVTDIQAWEARTGATRPFMQASITRLSARR